MRKLDAAIEGIDEVGSTLQDNGIDAIILNFDASRPPGTYDKYQCANLVVNISSQK